MTSYIISGQYPKIIKELKACGYSIITTDKIDILLEPEQLHADMQVLPINNSIFILRECYGLSKKLIKQNLIFTEKPVGRSYPENIALNFLFISGKIYGKLSAMDRRLREYCEQNNIPMININQGYARCSALALNDQAVITADSSICKALKKDGLEMLTISSGSIRLEGFDYGFIGGCAGLFDDKIIFFGNAEAHPDWKRIKRFCEANSVRTKIICKHMPLTDIGGVVRI